MDGYIMIWTRNLIAFLVSMVIVFLSLFGLLLHIQGNIQSPAFEQPSMSQNSGTLYNAAVAAAVFGNFFDKLTITDLFLLLILWPSGISFSFFTHELIKNLRDLFCTEQ